MNRRAFAFGVAMVFLGMAAAVALRAYAEAAFLRSYGAKWLPHLLVSHAVAFAAGTTLYDAASSRASLPWVDAALVIALAAAAGAAPTLVAGGGAWPFVVALVVIALSSVVMLALWNALCASIAGRDARRWLPRAGAAVTAGGAVAGLGAAVVIPRLGPEVVPYAAAVLTASLLVVSALQRAALRAGGAPGATAPPGTSATAMTSDHRQLIRWLLVAAVLESAVATAIEFAFGAAMKGRYAGADLATAIAAFYGGTNALLLLIQATLVPRLLTSQRLPLTVSVHPLVTGLGLAALAAVPGFGALAIVRTGDAVLRAATSRTGQELALSALPPVPRARWKVLLRGAATPLGAALAAGALVLAGKAAITEPRAVALAALLVLLVWLGAVRAAARGFVAALAAPLGMKRVAQVRRTATLQLDELHRLVAAAGDPSPRIGALAAAGLASAAGNADEIVAHLDHEDAQVRATLYALAARRPRASARAELRGAARIEDDPGALAAAIKALAAHGDAAAVAAARDQAVLEPDVARAARAALAQLGQGDDRAARIAIDEQIAVDGDWAAELVRARPAAIDAAALDRAIAAAIARGGESRRQALRAAAGCGGPGGIGALLAALGVADQDGFAAVVDLGTADAAHLGAQLTALAAPAAARAAVARAIAAAPDAGALLAQLANDDDDEVRDAALRGLAGAARAGHLPTVAVATRAVDRELAGFAAHVAARAPSGDRPALHEAELARASRLALRRLLLAVALDTAAVGGDPAPLAAAERRLASRSEATRRRALDVLQEVARARPRLLDAVERWLRPASAGAGRDGARLDALATHDAWLAGLLRGDHAAAEPRLAALRACAFFDELAGRHAAALATEAEALAFEAGAVVMTEGEHGAAMYVVLEGALIVAIGGVERVRLGAGGVVGELAAVDDAPRAATVTAAAPSRLLAIRRDAFAAALDRWPDLGTGLLRTLATRIRGG